MNNDKKELIIIHKISDWGLHYSDDKILLEYLARFFTIKIVDWKKASPEDLRGKLILLRYPEDYIASSSKFIDWYSALSQTARILINPLEDVKHFLNKEYLLHINIDGISLVPTINGIDAHKKIDLLKEWKVLVIKPKIGESGKNVEKINIKDLNVNKIDLCNNLIQKYIENIKLGEISLIFIGSDYSHSIIRYPNKDFRVDWESAIEHKSIKHLINNSMKIIKETGISGYCRIDWIQESDNFLLSEIEVIDPILFFGKIKKGRQLKTLKLFKELLIKHE